MLCLDLVCHLANAFILLQQGLQASHHLGRVEFAVADEGVERGHSVAEVDRVLLERLPVAAVVLLHCRHDCGAVLAAHHRHVLDNGVKLRQPRAVRLRAGVCELLQTRRHSACLLVGDICAAGGLVVVGVGEQLEEALGGLQLLRLRLLEADVHADLARERGGALLRPLRLLGQACSHLVQLRLAGGEGLDVLLELLDRCVLLENALVRRFLEGEL
mmetsp:Transcript_19463/g.74698  ORF Transcript_19463/g.74698 Transcript_19463/m.74698 type:complete len:216 (-) Transcript_19463:3363-4010(-)